ncbi:MAG: helix-turn-helix transcriptional regulator [Anaerotignum sp.]|nr:helix-turn-helix transcriptional regulator [Anaerotignum sp.]
MQSEKVGIIIRKARLQQKITQKQLADKMDISDKAISKWECGYGNPDISLILKLSNILDIDVRELLKVYEKHE